MKKNTKFRLQIPTELRIGFRLDSVFRRFAREGKPTYFSGIILEIMPLLQNGVTPDNQTILGVLEYITVRVGEDSRKLREAEQIYLFDSV